MASAATYPRARYFIVAALLIVQGCSGGGGSATPNPVVPSPSAPAHPTPAKASVTFKVFIPAKKATTSGRRRAFVSSSTNGLMISVYTSPESSNPTPVATTDIDLSASSSACTASATGRTCTAIFPAPPGTVDVVFTSYDKAPVGGAFPAGANELATATLAGLTVVLGTDNSFSVALGGVVSSITLVPGFRSLDAAVSGSYPLGVTAFDADGNMIVAGSVTATNGSSSETDTYANPITLTVSAGGSDTALSLNGTTAASSVTLTKSSDGVTVAYDGAAASGYSATIGASASGATGATATFAPLFATPRSLSFTAASQTQTVALSESGFTGTFAAAVTNAGSTACPSGAVTLGTIASGSPASLTVTSGSTTATGCTIAISDATTTVDLTASVTMSGTTIVVPAHAILAAVGNSVETINLDNTAQTSTLTVSVPGAPGGDSVTVLGVARDTAGTVYVDAGAGSPEFPSNYDATALEAFTAGATGAATPLATISIPTSCESSNIAVDRQKNVYVACTDGGSILEYAAGLQSSTPVATITGINNTAAVGVAVDASGNVYTGLYLPNQAEGGITEYAPPPAGTDNASPIRAINGSSTELGYAVSSVTVDASGNLYAITELIGEAALEFGPQAVGNVAPSTTFPSNESNDAVIVDPAGSKLYLAYTSGNDSFLAMYSVANPSATPQTIPLPSLANQLSL
jgi:hypothetical protein